jgi:hypothetical protein
MRSVGQKTVSDFTAEELSGGSNGGAPADAVESRPRHIAPS